MTQLNTAKAQLLKNGEWTLIEDFVSVALLGNDNLGKVLDDSGYVPYLVLRSNDEFRVFLTIWKNISDNPNPKFYVELEISEDYPDSFYLQDVPDLLKFMADSKPALDLVMSDYKDAE